MGENIFGETVSDIRYIKRIYNQKNDNFDYLDVKIGTEQHYVEEGWELYKEYKIKTKLRKPKNFDIKFEDKSWCVFSKLGFDEINEDRNFKIPISKSDDVNPKQIDLFVKDKNVALVVECKSAKERTKKSLRDAINEISGYRSELIKSVKSRYDRDLKIGFIILTKNIILGNSDLELAKTNNIVLMNETKLEYYRDLSKQIGTSSKYQLLAEIFQGQGIKNLSCQVPAIRSKANGRKFYSFLIEPSKLLPIAFVAHKLKTEGEVKSYQRIIQKKKLEKIKKYITEENGIFPNSVILNFQTKQSGLKFDLIPNQGDHGNAKFGTLHLPANYKSAWIIDGQHRLYGFTDTEEASKALLPVIAFENLSASDQSTFFVDINSKQTNVPKNLLQELYSSLFWESDKEDDKLLALISKICSDLGNDLDSPIYGKIKSSNSSDGRNVPITLNALTDALRKYKLIAEVDSRSNKITSYKALYSIKEPCMDNTLARAKLIIKTYFSWFQEQIPGNWNLSPHDGGYLCSNNGLTALLIVLGEVLKYLDSQTHNNLHQIPETDLLENDVSPLIQPVLDFFKAASVDDFRKFKAQQGAAGQKNCAFQLMNVINAKFDDFNPVGLKEYLEDNNDSQTLEAKSILHMLELKIHAHVVSSLKKAYPDTSDSWWRQGVPKKVQREVALRKIEDDLDSDEEGFSLIDYCDTIFANWDIFSDTYSILEKGKSGKKNALSWFSRLNGIRNICSHPARGNVSKNDYEFILKIDQILQERID